MDAATRNLESNELRAILSLINARKAEGKPTKRNPDSKELLEIRKRKFGHLLGKPRQPRTHPEDDKMRDVTITRIREIARGYGVADAGDMNRWDLVWLIGELTEK